MVIAAVGPVLELLAFALVAIAAISLVETFVVQPMQRGQSMVSGLPVLGGPLAWAIGQLVVAVQIGISAMTWMVQKGRVDAFNAWAWLVQNGVETLFHPALAGGAWINDRWGAVQWMIDHWNSLWGQSFTTLPNTVSSVIGDLGGLHHWIDGVQNPWIRGIGDDLAGLHSWIDNIQMPLIRGIGDDLAGLHHWIDANLVNRGQLAQAEQAILAKTGAATAVVADAITAIENSPCMQVCDELGGIGQLLQQLEDAGMLAIMMAMIEEAMHDPAAVRAALRDVVEPVLNDAVSSVGIN